MPVSSSTQRSATTRRRTSKTQTNKAQSKAAPKTESKKSTAARAKATAAAKALLNPDSAQVALTEKLFQAAWLAGASIEDGDERKVATQKTVEFLRTQPETVKAFDDATQRFQDWLAHRSATGAKAFAATTPFVREGTTENAFITSAQTVGGEDAKQVMEHGIQGLRTAGVPGAIAALVKFAETFKPHSEQLKKVAPTMNRAAAAVPGLQDAGVVAQGKDVGLDLVLAVHDIKECSKESKAFKASGNTDPEVRKEVSKKRWRAIGGLIKATSQLALWVMMACAPVVAAEA